MALIDVCNPGEEAARGEGALRPDGSTTDPGPAEDGAAAKAKATSTSDAEVEPATEASATDVRGCLTAPSLAAATAAASAAAIEAADDAEAECPAGPRLTTWTVRPSAASAAAAAAGGEDPSPDKKSGWEREDRMPGPGTATAEDEADEEE